MDSKHMDYQHLGHIQVPHFTAKSVSAQFWKVVTRIFRYRCVNCFIKNRAGR